MPGYFSPPLADFHKQLYVTSWVGLPLVWSKVFLVILQQKIKLKGQYFPLFIFVYLFLNPQLLGGLKSS